MPKLRTNGRPIVVDPVWPNAGVEVWYYTCLAEPIANAQIKLMAMIRSAWSDAPKLYAEDASPTSKLQQLLDKWAAQTIKAFDLTAKPLAIDFSGKAGKAAQISMMAQLKKAGFTVVFKPTPRSIQAYSAVAAENVALIKSIPRKWHEQIEQQVWDAVRKGGDLATLSDDLRKTYGSTLKRAALIARDQNAKAKATIERVRQMELGITRGIWMHSNAGKEPRPTHLAMDGKPYDLAQGMWDSDENEHVHPGQLINCRCTMRPIIEGAEDDEEDKRVSLEPSPVLLQAALGNARRFAHMRSAGSYVQELRTLRSMRKDWKGETALRSEIDQFLKEA